MNSTNSLNDFEFFVLGLKTEGEAILRAADKQSATQISTGLNFLINCRGRIVTSGVGKSGIIASKFASTLTSTGAPSFFLHPTDALHGDLGGVLPQDVFVFLSNSGETDELLQLLPYIKRKKIPLISILGNTNSTLAQNSDCVLDASVEKEICPLNLAPTSSTTVSLAICDALAASLMRQRSISPEDFARNHPSGRLGKRLSLRVSDLMRGGDRNPIVPITANLLEVTNALTAFGSGAVNVIDQSGYLVGFFTDGDLRRTLQKTNPSLIGEAECKDFMSRDPLKVLENDLAYDAFTFSQDRDKPLTVLSVVDHMGRSRGILKIQDIIKSGIV